MSSSRPDHPRRRTWSRSRCRSHVPCSDRRLDCRGVKRIRPFELLAALLEPCCALPNEGAEHGCNHPRLRAPVRDQPHVASPLRDVVVRESVFRARRSAERQFVPGIDDLEFRPLRWPVEMIRSEWMAFQYVWADVQLQEQLIFGLCSNCELGRCMGGVGRCGLVGSCTARTLRSVYGVKWRAPNTGPLGPLVQDLGVPASAELVAPQAQFRCLPIDPARGHTEYRGDLGAGFRRFLAPAPCLRRATGRAVVMVMRIVGFADPRFAAGLPRCVEPPAMPRRTFRVVMGSHGTAVSSSG